MYYICVACNDKSLRHRMFITHCVSTQSMYIQTQTHVLWYVCWLGLYNGIINIIIYYWEHTTRRVLPLLYGKSVAAMCSDSLINEAQSRSGSNMCHKFVWTMINTMSCIAGVSFGCITSVFGILGPIGRRNRYIACWLYIVILVV